MVLVSFAHATIHGMLTPLFRVLANVLYCAKVNKDKANGKYDKYTGYSDDRDPDFTMIL